MTAEERERLAASRREYVDAHFHEKSYAEMAAALGISKSSVAAMASRMGLKNGESRSRLLSGRRRKELVRRERARTAFGLEQKSRLKVTANRAKVRLRYLLRKAGYADAGDRSTLYYGEGTARRGRLERKGAEAGLRFLPLPTGGEAPAEGGETAGEEQKRQKRERGRTCTDR